jgi:hypothetical protein
MLFKAYILDVEPTSRSDLWRYSSAITSAVYNN